MSKCNSIELYERDLPIWYTALPSSYGSTAVLTNFMSTGDQLGSSETGEPYATQQEQYNLQVMGSACN